MNASNQTPLESRQYVSEYLRREDDVVSHASDLFSAGYAEAVFAVDDEEPSTLSKVALSPLMLVGEFYGRKTNPHKPFFKNARCGRNKLMIFPKWLVRCTYQQYVEAQAAELFYFSGMPLVDIQDISMPNGCLMVYGAGNLGGSMFVPKSERDGLRKVFNDLKRDGRLPKANISQL